MSSYIEVYTPDQDRLLHSGKGVIHGVMISSTSATPDACTLYDYTGLGPPTGPRVFEVVCRDTTAQTILFNDRFAPRFNDGLWLHLGHNCYATIWYSIPSP